MCGSLFLGVWAYTVRPYTMLLSSFCRGRCLHRPAGGCKHPPLQSYKKFITPLFYQTPVGADSISARQLPQNKKRAAHLDGLLDFFVLVNTRRAN